MIVLLAIRRAVLTLGLAAVSLIALFPASGAAQGTGKPPTEGARKDVFVNLPPERAERVMVLQMELKVAYIELETSLRAQREELEELYRSYRFDEGRARDLRQKIRGTQDQLLERHHRFQVDLRELLTEAEFAALQSKFDKVRKENRKLGEEKERRKKLLKDAGLLKQETEAAKRKLEEGKGLKPEGKKPGTDDTASKGK